jgi:REP element-mobilizing transposase RayT
MGENPSPLGEDSRAFVRIGADVPFGQRCDEKNKRENIIQVAERNRMLAEKFWGLHLWACGYFAASSGNVTDEVIAKYIQLQSKQKRDRDDDFTIDGVESSLDD